LVAGPGAGVALLVYAGSSAILYALALTLPAAARRDEEPESAKLSILRSVPPIVLWLMGVTFLFNFLYGPIDVGLPIFVQHSLGHGSRLYGQLFTVFGVGSLIGGLTVGGLRRESVTQWVTVLSIMGWGGAALLLAAAHSPAVALLAFGVGGLLYGPFVAASVSAIQGATPPSEQGPVMAIWATVTLGALPVGTLVGGPMVAGLGTRGTFALCAVLTLVLGIATLAQVITSARTKAN
jgi:predicted MFS family arabinose efflux permease